MTSLRIPKADPKPPDSELPCYREWLRNSRRLWKDRLWPRWLRNPNNVSPIRIFWRESLLPRFIAAVKKPGRRNASLGAGEIALISHMLGHYIYALSLPPVEGRRPAWKPNTLGFDFDGLPVMCGSQYCRTVEELVEVAGPRVHPALAVWVHRRRPRRSEPAALPAEVPAEEFLALSRRTRPWMWGSEEELAETFDAHELEIVREYRMEPDQLLADAITDYMHHPRQTRETAPRFVQWLQDLAADKKMIRRLVAFVETGRTKVDDAGPV